MEFLKTVINLLFGPDPELRGIIWVTLRMSVTSTFFSSLIGIPIGTLLGLREFRGKAFFNRLNSTLMGVPPVVGGLLVFLLLSRSGPLGQFKLLYTITAMVIAQVILITPIIIGLTYNLVALRANAIRETCAGIGLSAKEQLWITLKEFRIPFISIILTGFGRSIAEVGAIQMVGGNIQFKTRVMTTAIMMQSNMGRFELGIALGVVLLLLSFAIHTLVHRIEVGWQHG